MECMCYDEVHSRICVSNTLKRVGSFYCSKLARRPVGHKTQVLRMYYRPTTLLERAIVLFNRNETSRRAFVSWIAGMALSMR